MENNKPFSFLAILNPEFPGIRFRVTVWPNNQADKNSATPFGKGMINSFYDELNSDELIQNQETIISNNKQTQEKICHEANFYIIFTNQNF